MEEGGGLRNIWNYNICGKISKISKLKTILKFIKRKTYNKILTKDLSLCHKLKFSYSYISLHLDVVNL